MVLRKNGTRTIQTRVEPGRRFYVTAIFQRSPFKDEHKKYTYCSSITYSAKKVVHRICNLQELKKKDWVFFNPLIDG